MTTKSGSLSPAEILAWLREVNELEKTAESHLERLQNLKFELTESLKPIIGRGDFLPLLLVSTTDEPALAHLWRADTGELDIGFMSVKEASDLNWPDESPNHAV